MDDRGADAPAAPVPPPAAPAAISPPSRPRGLARVRTPLAVFAVALVVAVLVAPIPTLTWQATAVTVVVGLVVVALVATGRPPRAGGAKRVSLRSAAPWLVLAVAFTVLELAALAAGSRPEFPTISYLLGPEFVDATVRLVGYVAWLCTGWWLVRR